jgi:hypothetical protein
VGSGHLTRFGYCVTICHKVFYRVKKTTFSSRYDIEDFLNCRLSSICDSIFFKDLMLKHATKPRHSSNE